MCVPEATFRQKANRLPRPAFPRYARAALNLGSQRMLRNPNGESKSQTGSRMHAIL